MEEGIPQEEAAVEEEVMEEGILEKEAVVEEVMEEGILQVLVAGTVVE